ncbi:hypothetical protein QT381_10415 [Galbitalea sp. SE-J8]|uniref:hypothetical protein n=1 Tax=Galbitalea sp. SE-J8 TaxID=3054952 RepID=UPI00259CC3CB|nr:hypothetical protein [Galbitalea sp. SE-J8]MDM4763422.1 hypothetical protein [Galbitalea sp. SE-J8]
MDDHENGQSDLADRHETFRITSSLTRSTGFGDATVSKVSGLVSLAKRTSRSLDPSQGSGYPASYSPLQTDFFYLIDAGVMPQVPTTIVAIDPASESKLDQARSAGVYKQLADLPADRSEQIPSNWAARVDSDEFSIQRQALTSATQDGPEVVVPLIVNESPAARLKLTVHVDRYVGSAPIKDEGDLARVQSADLVPYRTLAKDVSSLLVPFSNPDVTVQLGSAKLRDGETAGSLYQNFTSLKAEAAEPPTYKTSRTGVGGDVEVVPLGVVGADGRPVGVGRIATENPDEGLGAARAYRNTVLSKEGSIPLAAPVGTFTSKELTDGGVDSISYVPSGLSNGSGAKIVAAAANAPQKVGQTVDSNLTGVDFISDSPGAITDLEGGRTLRGDSPIDAVRVRVKGVTSFNADGRAAINSVARRISELGKLSVRVVAGSSPETVDVYVPGYNVSPSGDADLGVVAEEWTTLGAAVRVDSAMNDLVRRLIVLTCAGLIFVFGSAAAVSAVRRRRESALLRQLGWSEAAIAVSLLRRQLVSVTLIAGACASASAWSHWAGTVVSVSTLVLGAVCLAMVLSTVVSLGAVRTRDLVRVRSVFSVPALTALRVASTWRTWITLAVGILMTGLYAYSTSAAVDYAVRDSGRTRLSGAVLAEVFGPTLALGAMGLVGVFVLLALGVAASNRQSEGLEWVLRMLGLDSWIARRIRVVQVALAVSFAAVGDLILLLVLRPEGDNASVLLSIAVGGQLLASGVLFGVSLGGRVLVRQ